MSPFDVLRSDRYRVLASESGEVKVCDPVTFAILCQFQFPTDDPSLFDVLHAFFRPKPAASEVVVSKSETTAPFEPASDIKPVGRRRKRS